MTTNDQDFPPPSEEEIRESERLRDALEGKGSSDDAELLESVRSAAAPKPLDPKALDALADGAVATMRPRRGGVVVRVAFGASVLVAAAAAVVIFVTRGPAAPAPELARARSTQPLFHDFDLQGGESARIDRIVVARAADLRENRFARWGVTDGNRGRR